ncbi:MAG: hypothetical protein ACRDD7_15870 [Peptostreptococcaceae bacterium]
MSKKIIKQINVDNVPHYISTDTDNIFDRSGKTQEEINALLLSKVLEYDGLLQDNIKEYGLEVDFEAETFTRLGDASAFPMDLTAQSATNPFDDILPWGGMTRCIVNDDKSVVLLYGVGGYTEDGSVGQVMVRIPKFYYKVEPIKFESNPNGASGKQALKLRYWICMSKKRGYKTHPAFFDKFGYEVPYLYFSAYEGSVWNKTTEFYNLTDAQDTNFDTDMLCSIKGAKPCSGVTQNLIIENARKLANNRGNGWEQQDFTSTSAIQLLLMMEYASTDSQVKVGQGAVNLASGTGNESLITGGTSSLGNKSGYVGVNSQSSVSYRGIENFWGNIWKFVDGFNIEAKGIHQGWVAERNGDYKCNIKTNCKPTSNISKANGYVDRIGYIESCDYGFIPTRSTGSSSKPMNDYLYQNSTYNGFLIALLGGSWSIGADAGCFSWNLLNAAASSRYRSIGARLACR